MSMRAINNHRETDRTLRRGNPASAQPLRRLPMLTLSATDLAIALAVKAGTLRLTERASRLGGTFVAIEDAVGVIEVASDMAEAERRIAEVCQ